MSLLAVDHAMLREPRLWLPRQAPTGRMTVNRTHSLSRGLLDCVLVDAGGIYSAMTGIRGVNAGTPGTMEGTPEGLGFNTKTQSVATNYSTIALPSHSSPVNTSSLTLMVHGLIPSDTPAATTGTSASTLRSMFSYDHNTTPQGVGIGEGASGIVILIATLTSNRVVTLGTCVYGVPFVGFGWFDLASTTWKGQLDHSAVVENTSTTSLAITEPTSPRSRSGYISSTASPGNKTLLAGMIWLRVLSSNERNSLVDNPYQFLSPV